MIKWDNTRTNSSGTVIREAHFASDGVNLTLRDVGNKWLTLEGQADEFVYGTAERRGRTWIATYRTAPPQYRFHLSKEEAIDFLLGEDAQ
jgi:hypothetical protein